MSFEMKVTCDKCERTLTTKGWSPDHYIFSANVKDVPQILSMYEVSGGKHLCWECSDEVFGKEG
jgi:hypothetical protein